MTLLEPDALPLYSLLCVPMAPPWHFLLPAHLWPSWRLFGPMRPCPDPHHCPEPLMTLSLTSAHAIRYSHHSVSHPRPELTPHKCWVLLSSRELPEPFAFSPSCFYLSPISFSLCLDHLEMGWFCDRIEDNECEVILQHIPMFLIFHNRIERIVPTSAYKSKYKYIRRSLYCFFCSHQLVK